MLLPPLLAAASAALLAVGGDVSNRQCLIPSVKRRRCHVLVAPLHAQQQSPSSVPSEDRIIIRNDDARTHNTSCNRRQYLLSASIATGSLVFWPTSPSPTHALDPAEMEFGPAGVQVELPLEASPGGTSSMRVTLMGKETTVSPRRKKYNGQGIRMVPYQVVRMVVDTGSPYLVVADGAATNCVIASGFIPVGDEDAFQNNLFDALLSSFSEDDEEDTTAFEFMQSDYGPTEEIYGSQGGQILWKSASAKFRDPKLASASPSGQVVLGVLDEALAAESGGPLLGLVKRSNAVSTKIQRRPTLLEQIRIASPDDPKMLNEVASFRLDYPNKALTLSSQPMMLPTEMTKAFDLVDLRPLGDFVEHYACLVEEVVFDGISFTSESLASRDEPRKRGIGRKKKRDIVAVFDSGLTGCLLIKPFYDRLVDGEGLDPSKFSSVDVRIKPCSSERGGKRKGSSNSRRGKKQGNSSYSQQLCTISSSKDTSKLYYVAPISLDWFDNEDTAPYVIVLGQTFLSQGCLTVDIDDRKAAFEVVDST